jgi:hypothetical protein
MDVVTSRCPRARHAAEFENKTKPTENHERDEIARKKQAAS